MLDEFIYKHKIYCIRKELNLDAPNEEVVLFRDLNGAQAFFRDVAKDRFAREDLMNVAKWIGISNMKSSNPKNAEHAQRMFEQLCLKIWAGDLLLVELKQPKVIKFEECCHKGIISINSILRSSKVLNRALLGSKLVLLFFSKPKGKKLVGKITVANEFKPTTPNINDWVLLARAMKAVPEISRNSARSIAGNEVRKHEIDNQRELRSFWEGTYDAFA